MEIVIFLAIAGALVWRFWLRRFLQVQRAARALALHPGFTPSFGFLDVIGTAALAIDMKRKKVFIMRGGRSSLYPFADILRADVCKNGVEFTKVNRGRQLVAAGLGHFLFGEKGFVVGGTTASTTTAERINSLSMKIYVQDPAFPITEFFFYRGTAAPIGSRKLSRSTTLLEEWYGRLQIVLANP